MTVYRLVRANRTSLDGKGAALFPGRWNNENIPCIYTSSSSSLAQLEVLVNIDDWKLFAHVPHVIMRIFVPDRKIRQLEETDLPKDWNRAVSYYSTQQFGTEHLTNFSLLGFSVPSSVNKLERNIVLNPRSDSFSSVQIEEQFAFELDSRLLQ
jgi:RES domain-containing protein